MEVRPWIDASRDGRIGFRGPGLLLIEDTIQKSVPLFELKTSSSSMGA
jgi:hypothetical protein